MLISDLQKKLKKLKATGDRYVYVEIDGKLHSVINVEQGTRDFGNDQWEDYTVLRVGQ